jgi:hypothetical protein
VRRRPNLFAAIAAAAIVLLALSPLLYGLLMLRAHVSGPPVWIVVLFYLGFPGLSWRRLLQAIAEWRAFLWQSLLIGSSTFIVSHDWLVAQFQAVDEASS